MPQNSLFPEHQPPPILRLELRGSDLTVGRQHLEVAVMCPQRESLDGLVHLGRYPGIESDFLPTLVTEVSLAWAFGEGLRDIRRAATDVKKCATAHAHLHGI